MTDSGQAMGVRPTESGPRRLVGKSKNNRTVTDEMLDVAEFAIGGKVIRPATGTLGPNGVVRCRPPIGGADRE